MIALVPWERVTERSGLSTLRPAGVVGEYTTIELVEAAPGVLTLVRCDAMAVLPAGGIRLPDKADDPLPALTRNAVGTALGLTLTRSATVGALAAELLIDHADDTRADRPNVLRPAKAGVFDVFEIHLGRPGDPPIYQQVAPRVRGGAVYTEDFTASNGELNANGGDLTWNEGDADWDIVSNRCQLTTDQGSVIHYARAEHDSASSDNYAQAKGYLGTPADWAEVDQFGVGCRMSASANTCYATWWRNGNLLLKRLNAASETDLASTAVTWVDGTAVKVSANGSTIKSYYGGTEKSSVTNTVIASGTRGGIEGYNNRPDTFFIWDDFEFGDLAAAAPNRVHRPVLQAVNRSAVY